MVKLQIQQLNSSEKHQNDEYEIANAIQSQIYGGGDRVPNEILDIGLAFANSEFSIALFRAALNGDDIFGNTAIDT